MSRYLVFGSIETWYLNRDGTDCSDAKEPPSIQKNHIFFLSLFWQAGGRDRGATGEPIVPGENANEPVEGVDQLCPHNSRKLIISFVYSHLNQVKLQSQYEEGITGVHLMNKYQQQYAMDEFVAGDQKI